MKGIEFPIIGTKVPGLTKKFNISDPQGRKAYFEAKVGKEIELLKRFFKENIFIAYLIGMKNSGKGTYSKLFAEIFREEKFAHVSVGDLIRDVHSNWDKFSKSSEFEQLKRIYRGYTSFDEAVDALLGRSAEKLLPTELILALLKIKIGALERQTIFIDGLPRDLDQVSYSLFFRDLINYREDVDIFILIDIPQTVISERIKYRVVCPLCNTSRNSKLLITSKIEYDQTDKKFYLFCDNPDCEGSRMEPKEGDELGIEPILPRLKKEEEIMRTVFSLRGVPKILLRNHVPVTEAKKYYDDYELTPEYSFEYDEARRQVMIKEKSWIIKDNNGVASYSLLAPPVVITMIKQLVGVFNLG